MNWCLSLLDASAGSALQVPPQQQADQDKWLLWEASVLRPATYSSNTAEPLAALEAALSKSSSGLLLGSSTLSLADVSRAVLSMSVLAAAGQSATPAVILRPEQQCDCCKEAVASSAPATSSISPFVLFGLKPSCLTA